MSEERRIILNIDLPRNTSLPVALGAISFEMEDNDEDSGYADTEGGSVSWRVRSPGDGVPLDPRQREAAALLIMGFDLPADAISACINGLEAADVMPGMRFTGFRQEQRRINLLEAKRLIDEMLSEG